MTMTRILALVRLWWPAAIAAVLVLSTFSGNALSSWHSLATLAFVIACSAFALSRGAPRVAASLALLSHVLVTGAMSADAVALGYWSDYMPVAALGAVAGFVAVASVPEPRVRLILGGATVVAAFVGVGLLVAPTLATSYFSVMVAPGQAVLTFIVPLLVWGAAFGSRWILDLVQAATTREALQARATVVESELRDERLRADITHDFHDVMAHSLAVLAAQAEGLRLTHREHPERIDPVLTTISDTARLALVEVRQLLERVDDDARRPQPLVADIPAIIDQTRSAGPRVAYYDLGRHGSLPRVGEIAAYRIVQESLTNALRHGGSDIDIVVTLSWAGPGVSIAVSSPIIDRSALSPMGRGITGMHERAKQAGGWVEIDAEGGDFVVTAYLPYQPADAAAAGPLLTEDALPTVPVATLGGMPAEERPESVVAPWIVRASEHEAARAAAHRGAEHRAAEHRAAEQRAAEQRAAEHASDVAGDHPSDQAAERHAAHLTAEQRATDRTTDRAAEHCAADRAPGDHAASWSESAQHVTLTRGSDGRIPNPMAPSDPTGNA